MTYAKKAAAICPSLRYIMVGDWGWIIIRGCYCLAQTTHIHLQNLDHDEIGQDDLFDICDLCYQGGLVTYCFR